MGEEVIGAVIESEKIHAPYYDDVVLKQEQELEVKENVAYGPMQQNITFKYACLNQVKFQ